MQFSLLIALLLVGSAQAQLSATRDQECKENETFTTCGSACEPSCDNQSPSFCTLQCVVGCQCDKGFYRKSAGACVTLAQCSTPVTAPPLPASNLTCPTNEEANACHNPCTEKKCPVANPPMVNCLLMCTNGCSCKKGYLRNMQGQCVKEAECPAVDSSENQCNLVDCRSGTSCKVQNGKAVCIPDYSDLPGNSTVDDINIQITPCSTMKCTSGTVCKNLLRNCTTPPCETYGSCILETLVDPMPISNETIPSGCATMRCASGTTCQETEVLCIKAPCQNHAECVPDTPINSTLGGCAAMSCAIGTTCQEAMVKCAKAPCPVHAACLPMETSNSTSGGCASVTCPIGEYCEETEVQCFVAPCPKAVSCVPSDTNQNSTARQGCDVVRCRDNEICQEQKVDCVKAPCPIQVICVSIVSVNSTSPNHGSSNSSNGVCSLNETMSTCLNTCSEPKCAGLETSMMCTKHCGQGCACKPGFLRSADGECYREADCPADQICGLNEEYRCEKCAGTCKTPEPNCPGPKNKKCQKKCICAAGFVKKNGKCVTLASCPDHDHTNITCLGTEEYTDCMPKCTQLCSGVQECDKDIGAEVCKPGCVCRPNYKMDSNGVCVHNRHCFKTTDCPLNEEWAKCTADDNLCGMATIQKVALRDSCFSGCICSTGFARNSNGTCVEQSMC